VIFFREIQPKDFYLAQILRQQGGSYLELLERLTLNPEVLAEIPSRRFRTILKWAEENLLAEKVFGVENWMEVSFHLCKQRWDGSMDWLEQQPISKILLMIDIVKKHNDEQESAMKKANKR
jgi:hypothetical protein